MTFAPHFPDGSSADRAKQQRGGVEVLLKEKTVSIHTLISQRALPLEAPIHFHFLHRFRHEMLSHFRRWSILAVTLLVLLVRDNHAFGPSQHVVRTATLRSSSLSMVNTERRNSQKNNSKDAFVEKDGITQEYNPFHLPVEATNNQMQTAVGSDIQEFMEGQDEEEIQKIGIWAARGLLLFIAIIWGTNFATVKYVQGLCFHPPCVHPPSEAALARFGVAAAVSIPLLIGQKKDIILGGLECGLWIALGYITQAIALKEIDAGTCAFICSLTVVACPALSFLLQGKPPKPTQMVAAVVALAGVGILEGMVDTNALLGIQPAIADTGVGVSESALALSSVVASSSVSTASAVTAAGAAGPLATIANALGVSKGDIIALGQPLGFGYAFMRIEHYVDKFKEEENQVITLAAAQCVAVGLVSLLWVLYDYNGVLPDFGYMIEPHRIAAILWTGIVTTVVAINLQAVALQTATATDAALTFASEPVWASIFGVWLLKEQVDTNAYVGGAVILAACVIGALADFPQGELTDTKEAEEMP